MNVFKAVDNEREVDRIKIEESFTNTTPDDLLPMLRTLGGVQRVPTVVEPTMAADHTESSFDESGPTASAPMGLFARLKMRSAVLVPKKIGSANVAGKSPTPPTPFKHR